MKIVRIGGRGQERLAVSADGVVAHLLPEGTDMFDADGLASARRVAEAPGDEPAIEIDGVRLGVPLDGGRDSRRPSTGPGDVILTGTPEGVGAGFDPARFLATGDVVTARIEGLGEQRHRFVGSNYVDRGEQR